MKQLQFIFTDYNTFLEKIKELVSVGFYITKNISTEEQVVNFFEKQNRNKTIYFSIMTGFSDDHQKLEWDYYKTHENYKNSKLENKKIFSNIEFVEYGF